MALTPKNPITPANPADKRKETEAAQEDVLMREVDEAVRQDDLSEFIGKYGKPLLGIVIAGLAAFALYLFWWVPSQEGPLEEQSENLTRALDQLEAGNLDTSTATLGEIAANGDSGAKAAALMLQGGIALQQGNSAEAAKIFSSVAGDESAPSGMRDLATIREIAAKFDTVKSEEVIARLKPMAVPGNAYFGSAGEMVAMAYLDQGKRKEAGTLFAEISRNEDVPESLRGRARDMAGLLGVDAIDKVEDVLEDVGVKQDAPAPAAQ